MHRIVFMGFVCLTPATGFAQVATVTVDPTRPGYPVTNQIMGMNMANWVDQTQAALAPALKIGAIRATRWPGGSASDAFHWQSNSECGGGYVDASGTFDLFMTHVAQPDRMNVAVTLNYGSNAACNGGGDPVEAAAWVSYAKTQGYGVNYWTVGNEVYGSWEYDLHAQPHDAATYAAAVAGQFYPAIKQANKTAQVGVVVEPNWRPAWDPIVLAQASYDFVEYHFYAQEPGQESDAYLLTQAPQAFTQQINTLKSELETAGHQDTPIYVGELGSVSYNPGKQTSSITQALYAGQMLGEMMNAGVARATWWLGFGGCSDASGGNFSSSLYGWQSFGGYMTWSDGTPTYGCPNAPAVPIGTPLPTARAFQLFGLVAHPGERVLPVTLSGSSSTLRAYALTHRTGTALVLFNLDQNNTLPVSIAINGVTRTSSVLVDTYDRAIYDLSQGNVWDGPSSSRLKGGSLPMVVTLQPWSMTVLRLAE